MRCWLQSESWEALKTSLEWTRPLRSARQGSSPSRCAAPRSRRSRAFSFHDILPHRSLVSETTASSDQSGCRR